MHDPEPDAVTPPGRLIILTVTGFAAPSKSLVTVTILSPVDPGYIVRLDAIKE